MQCLVETFWQIIETTFVNCHLHCYDGLRMSLINNSDIPVIIVYDVTTCYSLFRVWGLWRAPSRCHIDSPLSNWVVTMTRHCMLGSYLWFTDAQGFTSAMDHFNPFSEEGQIISILSLPQRLWMCIATLGIYPQPLSSQLVFQYSPYPVEYGYMNKNWISLCQVTAASGDWDH